MAKGIIDKNKAGKGLGSGTGIAILNRSEEASFEKIFKGGEGTSYAKI